MKSKTFLLISTLLISFVLSCDDNGSAILRLLQDVKNSSPDFIEQLKNMKECQTPALKKICGKGYNYWNSLINCQYFKGLRRDKENLEPFLADLLDGLPIEKEDVKKILSYLKKMTEAKAGFTEALGLSIIYYKNATESAKKGCYFTFLIESNCENESEIDILFTEIKTNAPIGKDVFVLVEGSGNFFEGSYEQKVIEENADLSTEQYNALFKLLLFSSYQSAFDIVNQF